MCQIDLNKLVSAGMICMNQDIIITPTRTGELMAKYYVAFETMKLFTQITGTEILMQILALISKCHEFSELRLRVNDKKTLNLLNKNSSKDTIRFPLNGKIKSGDMKVNCIIQAVLGNLDITDHSILSDSFTIMRNGNRIVKCLTDYLATKGKNVYSALLYSIILGKCFHAKLWENSLFVSKQLSGIGSVLSTQLVNAGKTSFDKILESNPRDIELIVKKRPPMGDYLIEEVQHIPKYEMTLEKISEHNYCIQLKLTIQLKNLDYLQEKSTVSLKSAMSLLVGNNLNEILIYERYQHSYMTEHPQLTKTFEMAITPDLENIEAHFISEDWVGIDCYSNMLFSSRTEKSKKPSEKSSKSQEIKQPSYIQMFLDMYMKIKKKPTKEKQTKKAHMQPKKGGKLLEKQKNDKIENAANIKSTSVGNIRTQIIKATDNNKSKKGCTKQSNSTDKIEAVENVNCDKIVQKVADKHLGFQFMNNNEDIIRNCLGIDKNSESASDTGDIEHSETFESIEEESIHVNFKKEASKQYENEEYTIKKDKLPDMPRKENNLEINTQENCVFPNDLVEEFFSDSTLWGQSTDQMMICQSGKDQIGFSSEIDPKNKENNNNLEIGKEQSEDEAETRLSFEFPIENVPSSSDTQKYPQMINRIVDYSNYEYISDNTQKHPSGSEVQSRSVIHNLSCSKDQTPGVEYQPEDQSEDNIYNEVEKKKEHDLHESCNSENDGDIEGVCDSVSETLPKKGLVSYSNTEMQQRTSNSQEQIYKNNGKSDHANSEIQSKAPEFSIDFDSILKKDPSIFFISQKYASDRDMQQKKKSFDTSYNQFTNKTSQINFKQNAQRKGYNQLMSRPKKKQKREWEDIHPAEQFEDKIYREKANLDNFRKPEKKKLSNYSEIDSYPDSTEVGERMETDKENQKSIKWRSPLVMSPAIKFSPKINFSSQFSKGNGFEVQNNMSNETMSTSLSSKNSRNAANLTVNIQKTAKQPKNVPNIFKSGKYRGTKFPLCDNDYCESPENSKSSLDYSDICSTPFLEGLRLKEQKKSTPKRYKQCEPSTATDYYTQFVNQSVAQKEKHEEKQESFKQKSSSPSIENKEKENIPKNEDHTHSENTRSQRDFNLSQSMCESEIVKEQMRNGFIDPRVSQNFMSQNRPMVYNQPMLPQSNSFRPPEFCNPLNRHRCTVIHPGQSCNGYYDPSRIQLPVGPEFSVNAAQGHFADTRYLKSPHDYRKLFQPSETLTPGYMQPMMAYNAPNGPDFQYTRCYPRLGQYRSQNDSFVPDMNFFRYSPVDGIPENYKYPPWPAMSYYHNPEVCVKQEYPDSEYMQSLQAPDPYMRQERLNFDTIQNSRFNDYSQVERPSQHLMYQESPFGRKTSFEELDKRSGEIKSLSQRNDDQFLPMNISSKIPFEERPIIPNNELIARRNMSAQDLNKSLMRNTFCEQTTDHYIPNISCPSNGFSNSQSFGYQNRNHLNYPENVFQSQMSIPRGLDYQQFHTPNDKEYVMNKFMYSLGQ